MSIFLGLNIGGTNCAVTLARAQDEGVSFIDRVEFPTPGTSEGTLSRLAYATGVLLQDHKLAKRHIAGTGVTCAGPLDSTNGVIMSPPNLPGWDNVRVTAWARDAFGAPALLQNDANASALAEHRYGAGRGTRHMVFLTFGTGMGAGLIIDGKIHSGANDNAGEIGHVRVSDYGPAGYGKIGSFEGFCSGSGIRQLGFVKAMQRQQLGTQAAFARDGLAGITAKSVAEAAEAGDPAALEVYAECGEMLGRGLAILVDIINPERIIIGSIYTRASGLMLSSMRAALLREALPQAAGVCEILPAALEDRLGGYAAVCVAMLAAEGAAREG